MPVAGIDDAAAAVLEFWFGTTDPGELREPRALWFARRPALDAAIRRRFEALWQEAAAGGLAEWAAAPATALARVIVLDQFPRNMFRGSARAFVSDAAAVAAAADALARGFDQAVAPLARWFLYLPFEHCEDLAAQRRAVALFAALPDAPAHRRALDYARRHLAIIERFGRFPHRNRLLGRVSSDAEEAFLQQPGSSF